MKTDPILSLRKGKGQYMPTNLPPNAKAAMMNHIIASPKYPTSGLAVPVPGASAVYTGPAPAGSNGYEETPEEILGQTPDPAVTPQELAAALELLVAARQPVMVWGPPGIGKSDIARQVAERRQAQYWDLRATTLDPVDLRGLPYLEEEPAAPNGRITRWAPPDLLPPQQSQEQHLINLDEITTVSDAVQAALYQLVLDRACGDYKLPEGAAIIACGNRQTDRAVAHRMSSALASRFVHLTLKTSVDEWCQWANREKIRIEIVSFIARFRPQLLHDFDPNSQHPAQPCPRTWQAASRILEGMSADARLHPGVGRKLLEGAIGPAAAAEFDAYLKIWRNLPDPDRIIERPQQGEIPEQPDVLFALCGAIYRKANEVNFPQIAEYAQRLDPEAGHYLIRGCLQEDPELQHTDTWIRWIVDHQ